MTARVLGAGSLVRLLGAWAGRGSAYRALADGLRLLVLDGRVPLHVALPGERDLAMALGVSRTTVGAAYALLREDGYLSSRPGARSITSVPGRDGGAPHPPGPGGVAADGVIDLAHACLPATEGGVHEAYTRALAELPAHLPGHGYEPVGLTALREAVARRFTERGLATTPDQVLITLGAQHALTLLVDVLTSPGDRVLVEHPTYPHALDALRHAGCRLVPVGVTVPADGSSAWDVPGLRAAVRQTAPRMAYLVPDFHNPTGALMPAEVRAEVAALAADGRMTLVVDETLVDLGLDGTPPPPLATHGEGVVTIGSTGKSFWAGLRVGWVRADPALVARLVGVRPVHDLGTPVLEQLAVTALLSDAEAVLGPRREALRERRRVLVDLLAGQLPDWRVPPAPGGLSVWAQLPGPTSTALAGTAHRYGLRLAAGPRFGVDGAFERCVRVPFALPVETLRLAVPRLALAHLAAQTGGAPDVLDQLA